VLRSCDITSRLKGAGPDKTWQSGSREPGKREQFLFSKRLDNGPVRGLCEKAGRNVCEPRCSLVNAKTRRATLYLIGEANSLRYEPGWRRPPPGYQGRHALKAISRNLRDPYCRRGSPISETAKWRAGGAGVRQAHSSNDAEDSITSASEGA